MDFPFNLSWNIHPLTPIRLPTVFLNQPINSLSLETAALESSDDLCIPPLPTLIRSIATGSIMPAALILH